MSFDSVFNGDPTTPGVSASGKASLGVNLATGQLYVKDDSVAGWQKNAGGGGGTSNDITNESVVPGVTVTEALNILNTSSGPLSFSATLTSAQLLALPTSPVPIGPIPVIGTYIFPISVVAEYDAGATPYSVSGVTLFLGLTTFLTDGNLAWQSFSGPNFIDQAASQVIGEAGAVGLPLPTANISGVQLAFAANGGTITLGNGSMKLTVTYYVLALG